MRLTGLLSLALPAALFAQAPVTAQPSDTQAVLATIERMAAGMRSKDSAQMMTAFHPTARLVGMRPAAQGSTRMQVLTAAQFAGFAAHDPRPDWTERFFEVEIRMRGSLATVWARYDFHFGPTFSHCGIDAIQLLKTDQGWQIVSIADTYEATGCR